VLSARLTPPFAFFGHSMGAALAFEITRRLCRVGRPLPFHLFVSGRSAPRTPYEEDPIHDLPREEFFEALRRFEGTPEEVLQHEELMAMLEPILRADFSVSETYEYSLDSEPLPVPITVLGGVRDDEVPVEKLEAWAQETDLGCRRHLLEGGHFFLHERRGEVLDIVGRELARHLAPTPAH
jgi:medium-chain acyl-[acyl-carrier-protein] hydrolase